MCKYIHFSIQGFRTAVARVSAIRPEHRLIDSRDGENNVCAKAFVHSPSISYQRKSSAHALPGYTSLASPCISNCARCQRTFHLLIQQTFHVLTAFTLSVVEAVPSRVLASAFPQGATRSADAPHKCLRSSFSLRPSGRRYKTAIECPDPEIPCTVFRGSDLQSLCANFCSCQGTASAVP